MFKQIKTTIHSLSFDGYPFSLYSVIQLESPTMAELLNQRYQLNHKLGHGGFGTVYHATDLVLDREVAVKILSFSGEEHEELARRFISEARIASKLTHPNALTIYDFGENKEDERCYLVSELLLGASLHERLCEGALSVSEALEVTYQICAVLQEAHQLKIVHRDIKPANIFLNEQATTSTGRIKLLDFGIAKLMEGKSNTVTGQMMGTPHYMSPQQIVNIKLVDHRTDLYSLGVVLFHALVGKVPFNDESYYTIMRLHMQSPMPPLSIYPPLDPELTSALQRLVTQMTVKDHQKRIGSATEVMAMIEGIWAQYPVARGAHVSGMFQAILSDSSERASSSAPLTPQGLSLPSPPSDLSLPVVKEEPQGPSLKERSLTPETLSTLSSESDQDQAHAELTPEAPGQGQGQGQEDERRSSTQLELPAQLPPASPSPPYAWLLGVAGLLIALSVLTLRRPQEPSTPSASAPASLDSSDPLTPPTPSPQAGVSQGAPATIEPVTGGAPVDITPGLGGQERAGTQADDALKLGSLDPQSAGVSLTDAGSESAGVDGQAQVEPPDAGVLEDMSVQAEAQASRSETKTPEPPPKRKKKRVKRRPPPKLSVRLSKPNRPAFDVGDELTLHWRLSHPPPKVRRLYVKLPSFIEWRGPTRNLKLSGAQRFRFKKKGRGTLKVCYDQRDARCEAISLSATPLDPFEGGL